MDRTFLFKFLDKLIMNLGKIVWNYHCTVNSYFPESSQQITNLSYYTNILLKRFGENNKKKEVSIVSSQSEV
jgi:hypothetical protein